MLNVFYSRKDLKSLSDKAIFEIQTCVAFACTNINWNKVLVTFYFWASCTNFAISENDRGGQQELWCLKLGRIYISTAN